MPTEHVRVAAQIVTLAVALKDAPAGTRLIVVNGVCLGVYTGDAPAAAAPAKAPVIAKAASPQRGGAGSGVYAKLRPAIRKLLSSDEHPMTSGQIANKLRLPVGTRDRNNLSVLISKMRTTGELQIAAPGRYPGYRLVPGVVPKPEKTPGEGRSDKKRTRKMRHIPLGELTDRVLAVLREFKKPIRTQDVSDALGIPPNDLNRQRVGIVLKTLAASGLARPTSDARTPAYVAVFDATADQSKSSPQDEAAAQGDR